MNSQAFKQRDFPTTLKLLCHARGGSLLRNNNLNQSEIGRIARTSQANISRWMSSDARPTDENINLLATAFKITPAQMRGEMPILSIDGYQIQSPETEQFIRDFEQLAPEAQNMIREQVKLYAKLPRE